MRGSGLSYDLSEVDGNRRFTRAVTDLKPYQKGSAESAPSPANLAKQAPSSAEDEESQSAPSDDTAQLNSRRNVTTVLLSDFFNFENFPPLSRSQNEMLGPQNSPVPSQITPPTTEPETEPPEDMSDTSSMTSAESVIRRSHTGADSSTRSIIELDTMDDWTWNADAEPANSPDQSVAERTVQENPTSSTESSTSSSSLAQSSSNSPGTTGSETSSTVSSSAFSSQFNSNSAESSTSSTESSTTSPSQSSSNSAEQRNSECSVAEVPQAEMIPQHKQRVRACKFFKKDQQQGELKKINYKD